MEYPGTMNPRKLRWGILSTAQIARKNWRGIQLSGNGTVTAVASRDLERAQRFIAECQAQAPMEKAPMALGRYEDLLASAEVDAVYIPLPTGMRLEWILKAAKAGKHIICEKPCAVTVAELQQILDACQSNRVQFLDGVMFMHSQRLELMRQVLDDGESVGDIRRIASAFTFRQSPEFYLDNIRTNSALEPHGCLGDLGWYCIRFVLWAMHWQMPVQVTGKMLSQHHRSDSPLAVPTAFSGELFFKGGVSASFYSSFLTETEQWSRISGTKGCLEISDFVLPIAGAQLEFEVDKVDLKVDCCDFRMELKRDQFSVNEWSHGHVNAQETNLFRNFAAQVLSGTLNPLWPEIALKTQRVMEACLTSARSEGKYTMI